MFHIWIITNKIDNNSSLITRERRGSDRVVVRLTISCALFRVRASLMAKLTRNNIMW